MAFAAPLAIGLTAAGAGISAFGAMQEGAASSAMYNYQAGVAGLRRQVDLQNAEAARQEGEVAAQQSGMRTRWNVGLTRAGGNIDVNTGSRLAVQQSIQAIGQEDEAIIRAKAARTAYGYETEATMELTQAEIDRAAARQAKTSGIIKAVGSLVSGGASVAGKWTQASQLGLLGA